VRLETFLFLDLYPKGTDDSFSIPAHVFLRVSIEGDTLRAGLLDPEWLGKAVEQKKVAIPNVLAGDRIILTASTKELQEFVIWHALDEEAFPPAEFRRRD
jgi:hypothetical protein